MWAAAEPREKKLTDWWKQDLWKKNDTTCEIESGKGEREKKPGLTGGDEKELLTD